MNVDEEHAGLGIEARRALLKPGEVANAVMPSGTKLTILGRVPYDGSTRQQRRAMKRA